MYATQIHPSGQYEANRLFLITTVCVCHRNANYLHYATTHQYNVLNNKYRGLLGVRIEEFWRRWTGWCGARETWDGHRQMTSMYTSMF